MEPILTKILLELQSLRKEISQLKKNSPKTKNINTQEVSQYPTTVKKITQQFKGSPICWYHQRHGIAAKLSNCPGFPECNYNLPAEISRMKSTIAKLSNSSTPANDRIQQIRSSSITIKPLEQLTSETNIQQRSHTPPTTPPATQMDICTPINFLEEDLLTSDWRKLLTIFLGGRYVANQVIKLAFTNQIKSNIL